MKIFRTFTLALNIVTVGAMLQPAMSDRASTRVPGCVRDPFSAMNHEAA